MMEVFSALRSMQRLGQGAEGGYRRLSRWLLPLLAGWGGLLANGQEFALEVLNNSYATSDVVLSHPVASSWSGQVGYTLAERLADGTLAAVATALNTNGALPTVVWLAPGRSAPDSLRRFEWVAGDSPAFKGALKLKRESDRLVVENNHYRLHHPLQGNGGLPAGITQLPSGWQDQELCFFDRLVRKEAGGADGRTRVMQYFLKDCNRTAVRVLFESPLQVVVECKSGFGASGNEPPGNPEACYRYTYTANSPVVGVSARFQRTDDTPWQELNFLQPAHRQRYYTTVVTGDHGERQQLRGKGEAAAALRGREWVVWERGEHACGVGFGSVLAWDNALGNYVDYLRVSGGAWQERATCREGGLYLGLQGEPELYSRWLGGARLPRITLLRNGAPWIAQSVPELESDQCLANEALSLHFAGAERGFDLLGIDNTLGAQEMRFGRVPRGQAALWRLRFRDPEGNSRDEAGITIDNHAPARVVKCVKGRGKLTFHWLGIDFPDEPGAVDVRCEVTLGAGAAASQWRIKVTNRSQRYGLFSTLYPLLVNLAEPGTGEWLMPSGNWGGQLQRDLKGHFTRTYPSARCPVQMAAVNLGASGLYIAAHDGRATRKDINLSALGEFYFETLAEDAAQPGAAGYPRYPVVVAAYQGDWWQAARLYRAWALRQQWSRKGPIARRSDYPQSLTDLGIWLIRSSQTECSSMADAVEEAAERYAGVPLGVHWYRWHQIPFDHTYPEYFPAKEGMVEATAAMVKRGHLVMPYINGKLWDSEIPSFATALPYANKRPDGSHYIETYASKRKLVPMCPATPFWQRRMREVCHRLFAEYGVNAIYLDQIGASRPSPCYDPTHGHPLGGGSHWNDGYRRLLTPIKREAVRRKAVLTTENTAEPYMDNIDAYLTWGICEGQDVPLLPAVYAGYTTYFSSPQAISDDLEAFCAKQARDFLWGCQLGWHDKWILAERQRAKQQFQWELARYRLAARDFMVFGELLDEVRPLNRVPLRSHVMHNRRNQVRSVRLPAVMATLWRDRAARSLALFIVNNSAQEQSFEFELAPRRWLSGSAWSFQQLLIDGSLKPLTQGEGQLWLGSLAPREIRVLVCQPH